MHYRKVFSNALEQVLDFGLDGGEVRELVADPEEGKVEVALSEFGEQQVLVPAVGLADEAFGTVAVDGVLEASLRHGDEQLYLFGAFGVFPINGSQGIG